MARTERLFQLANLLRDRQRLRFEDMLERLDVSPATLKRDLRYLREQLGTPVEYDAFDRTYHVAETARRTRRELPGLWFAESELHALLLAHRLLADIDPQGQLAPRLKEVAERIESLQGQGGAAGRELLGRIKLISPGRREVDGDCFRTVVSALASRRMLKIRYFTRSRNEVGSREVSPLRLVHHRTWYLDAWCHHAQALRRFALDAVEAAEALEAAAREVPLHEVEGRMDGAYGVFGGEAVRWAVLAFAAPALPWVEREIWHPQQRTRRLPDGRLELQLPYAASTELVMDILRHGDAVEVLGDEALRAEVAARAQALARVYG